MTTSRLRLLLWPSFYAAIALAVAGPLLAPGYVFALDHAMGPRSADFYASYIAQNADPIQSKGGYALLLGALDLVIPMWLAQKLVLFGPFFLAGWGAHRLAQGRASTPASVFAGLLYALGPFAYVRGVAGQTGVLWAYALAPWFLMAWLSYVDTRRPRALVASVVLVAVTILFQAHGAVLLALLVAAHTAVRVARAPGAWKATLRAPVLLALWSLVVNAYWLVPVALAPRTTLDSIGAADRAVFATTSAGLPSVGLAALTLQGFWREAYTAPYPSAWLLAAPAIVLLLSIHALRQRRDDATIAIASAGALGFLLAVGTSSRLTAPFVEAMWDHVPLLRGFRDAHKFLALLALAYAWLAPVGFDALVAGVRALKLPRAAPVGLVALLLLVPLAGASPLMGGFGGQLGVTEYPAGWAEAEAITKDCDGTMIVLPWHLYADAAWVPNRDPRITGPAKVYFSCPTISSDALELGGAASQSSTPRVEHVDRWIKEEPFTGESSRAISEVLLPVEARYVLLLKQADHEAARAALDEEAGLRLVLDNAELRLYESVTDPAASSAPILPEGRGVPVQASAAAWVVSIAGLAALIAGGARRAAYGSDGGSSGSSRTWEK